ncbi:N-formylglutamate amidohydrolase [Candidatus Gracilibacteria bacterium 28_42_T64]|nr:N-formylglutamate amidohydrolase [Candidatus Gracilibacteria bacterium 28_42_T64]
MDNTGNNLVGPSVEGFSDSTGNSFIDDSLRLYSEEALKEYFYNPDNIKFGNFQSETFKEEGKEKYHSPLPDTCTLTFTHGTFALPSEVRHDHVNGVLEILSDVEGIETQIKLTKKQVGDLLRNYSDHLTRGQSRRALKRGRLTNKQLINHPLSRAIGDPNRPTQKNVVIIDSEGKKHFIQPEDREAYVLKKGERDWSDEGIRETDFNGISLLGNPQKFKKIGKDAGEKFSYTISDRLETIEEKNGYSITTDNHDTHTFKKTKNSDNDDLRAGGFPYFSLGTLDGESCHPEIMELFRMRFAYHLGIDESTILVNEPFTGGYTTIEHGLGYREKLKKEGKNPNIRNFIQIEDGRYLYSRGIEGKADHDKAEFVGECKIRALTDVDRAIQSGEIDLGFEIKKREK